MRGSYNPVPAPVPVPVESARWYFRFDMGAGYSNPPNPSHSGQPFGRQNSPGPAAAVSQPQPFGMGGRDFEGGGFLSNSTDDGNDFSNLYTFGVGYYASRHFRLDFTGEIRNRQLVRDNGTYRYRSFDFNGAGNNVYEAIVNGNGRNVQVNGSVTDETRLRSLLLMANYYYDMNSYFGLRPYLGAGVGIAYTEMDRRFREMTTTCEITAGSVGGGPCVTAPTAQVVSSTEDTQYQASLAASVMAGVTYKVSDMTHLDFNYRYLFVGGKENTLVINGANSEVDYGAQHEHYLRAGLRFDIR